MADDTKNETVRDSAAETANDETATEAAQDESPTASRLFDGLRGTRDALTVRRVFGDAYTIGDLTIIPVARVAGGGGGGGGEGHPEGETEGETKGAAGSGFGTGFGIHAHPVGVYEVAGGQATWKPAVDINRIVKGGQVLTGIIAVCVAIVLWSRR